MQKSSPTAITVQPSQWRPQDNGPTRRYRSATLSFSGLRFLIIFIILVLMMIVDVVGFGLCVYFVKICRFR